MSKLIGFLLGVGVRLLCMTLRVLVSGPGADEIGRCPVVLAFWHGRQMALLGAWRRPGTLVMVSRSKDGTLASGALGALGFRVVRGSSSRGGAASLKRIARIVRRERADAAFAVDGPRGPVFRAKPGAALAARLGNALLLPVGSAVSRATRLRSWDDFLIPWPFARVTIVVGEPLDARCAAVDPSLLDRALFDAEARAYEILLLRSARGEAQVLPA